MYRISQLAERSGLSRSTLLYYEKLGLLSGRRRANGYREYNDADLQRLILIQQLQAGGLTLQECKAYLSSRLEPDVLQQRLQQLDQEIASKQAARHLLASLLGADEGSLRNWHSHLEQTAPDAHFAWLKQQGFSEKDALQLRWLSRSMSNHDDYMNDFNRTFAGLDYHGPGSEADTLRAFASVPKGIKNILDIGCGTGAASLVLAQQGEISVTALDNSESSLQTLEGRAKKAGLTNKVKTCCASMLSIPFGDNGFDLIWCENSAYIMGVERALKEWQRLLSAGGYLVVSDLVWITNTPDDALKAFWLNAYPDMVTAEERLVQAEQAGYILVDHFNLSDSAWANYIEPLAARVTQLAPSMPGSQAIADLKEELVILRQCNKQFAYQMMVLKKHH